MKAGDIISANYVAKWNGSAWSALGWGMDALVSALTVDSSGSLYAGGAFTTAGGTNSAKGVAKWDGSAWSALSSGITTTTSTSSSVSALAVAPSGGIYAGGSFTTAGGVGANNVAVFTK